MEAIKKSGESDKKPHPRTRLLYYIIACQYLNKSYPQVNTFIKKVPKIDDPWKISAQARGELNGITQESFQTTVNEQGIGNSYLKKRKGIGRRYKNRMKKLLNAQEPEKSKGTRNKTEPSNFRKSKHPKTQKK